MHPAADLAAWRDTVARPEWPVVTVTVTEAGYRRDAPAGSTAPTPASSEDIAALPATGPVTTAPGRLVAGLLARREPAGRDHGRPLRQRARQRRDGPPRVVVELAAVDPDSPPGSCGLRLRHHHGGPDHAPARPATTAGLWPRPASTTRPVVTEPYTEWVLAGTFVAGRPAWETAGARFVDDIEPWENRKLWLLNGSHSLMAYAAAALRARTVAEAIADPAVRRWVEQWWDDAAAALPLPAAEVAAYRQDLLERYANPRIRHLLAQIATDGWQKVPIRILPVLRAERAAGRMPAGAVRAVAAWIAHLRGAGTPVKDAAAETAVGAATGEPAGATRRVLALLDIKLAADDALLAEVVSAL